ncbi:BREX-1 system adenine-specific DNA-methyltransferase PglX [Microbulbifer sp. MKSA007]|nr:BREX-1 system adenine-specific DNA-methyltransferase PglX [Microbulbifer sp. MKSA007]
MDTTRLKKFAQYARRSLIEQVESKLKLVMDRESEARREHPKAIAELEKKLAEQTEEQLIEQVAYIWFNRFCALRFMDVNQYNRIMVISPLAGQFQPEILAEAKAGHIDDGIVNAATREKVFGLLSGSIASRDGQSEAFRLLIVAVCNDLHRIMPYLFERIEDYTELLMPDDLLSGNSILAYTREAMTPEACESVESIGWLYQFYISEKKDEVFDGLKKNKKITPENIPAATQLFTPHWIVRYLVENSIGRLWMLNNPNSKVIEQMDYYIKPVEEEKDFLKISSPEEIKVCDPACGSGHMLTYAYDLLYAIYLDSGYDAIEIPRNILANNLYGIEIDERAAELAAFALTMKAVKGSPNDEGNNRRRFFRSPVEPNICRLEKVSFTEQELDSYIDFAGKDLFTQDLRETLKEFEGADNFGSLIRPTFKSPSSTLAALEGKNVSGELFLSDTHKSVLKVLYQAEFLQKKYNVVLANPPYMGKKNMNKELQAWVASCYPDTCADFFAMFIERSFKLVVECGIVSMVTMDSWMSGDEYTEFRESLLEESQILSLMHLGAHAFDEIKGEVVQVAAFTLGKGRRIDQKSDFFDLTKEGNSKEKEAAFLARRGLFRVSAKLFSELPRSVFAYFISDHSLSAFRDGLQLKEISEAFTGLQTGDNDRFMRRWFEVSSEDIFFKRDCLGEDFPGDIKWFPYVKGSDYRKWYGNNEYILNWQFDGAEIKEHKSSTVRNQSYYFRKGIAYNNISNRLSTRYVDSGFVFDQKNSMFFSEDDKSIPFTMAFLHSKVVVPLLRVVAPKGFGPGSMKVLPVINDYKKLYSVGGFQIELL